MFAVDDILISDDLLTAAFACDLSACKGACCVVGDSGAPLLEEERAVLERLVPRVARCLPPEALAVIEAEGVWEETGPGAYAVRTVGGGACVLARAERGVTRCALQMAYQKGEIDFEKPISCHLYPIRIETYGALEVLNYEQIDLCEGARRYGCRSRIALSDFLEAPLTRKYGPAWYAAFREIVEARRADLGVAVETAASPGNRSC